MRLIIQPRQAGKTYRLVEWVKAGEVTERYPFRSRILLVHSIREVIRMRQEHGLEPESVMSFEEWRDRYRPAFGPVELGVDNADMLLTQILGQAPSVISITQDGDTQ